MAKEIRSTDNYSSIFIDLKAKSEQRLSLSSSWNNSVVENKLNSKRSFKLPKIERNYPQDSYSQKQR